MVNLRGVVVDVGTKAVRDERAAKHVDTAQQTCLFAGLADAF
jgi:hypothetical protein